ncbi:MAG: orc1/cdc6 family replication initiation protein [Halolamina sp.]
MNEFADVERTVFRDKSILHEDHQPDEILERDDEIDAFRAALKDVLFGDDPNNVFVYGKAGLGKTVVTNYMMEELSAAAADRPEAEELAVLRHNCNGDGVYATVRSLINELRSPDDDTYPKTGMSTSHALETLYEEMDAFGGTVLCVLDEIDHLSDVDTLLYELPRARANGHLDDARVGVVGISNDYSFRNDLSPKVKSTLMEKEISFPAYDAGELQTILQARADRGLVTDAYDKGVINLCAAHAAKDAGSARQAIDLLREAGDLAESERADAVGQEHVEAAKDRVKRGRIEDKIREQTDHAQFVLEAIARLERHGEAPARSKHIRVAYMDLVEDSNIDPLTTLKSIQNHLADLEMLGFLTAHQHNDGRAGGSYHEYELDMDADAVIEVREDIREE